MPHNQCIGYEALIKGILPKGPYLPCVSMAGRALLAGYPWHMGHSLGHLCTYRWLIVINNSRYVSVIVSANIYYSKFFFRVKAQELGTDHSAPGKPRFSGFISHPEHSTKEIQPHELCMVIFFWCRGSPFCLSFSVYINESWCLVVQWTLVHCSPI